MDNFGSLGWPWPGSVGMLGFGSNFSSLLPIVMGSLAMAFSFPFCSIYFFFLRERESCKKYCWASLNGADDPVFSDNVGFLKLNVSYDLKYA